MEQFQAILLRFLEWAVGLAAVLLLVVGGPLTYAVQQRAAGRRIQAALDELGEDDYSEEDIRLMRIKFMSEMGN